MNKLTNNPTEQVSPQPSLGKDSSAKRDSNAQAVEPKSGDGCTDLQAALRKASEQLANELGAAEMLSGPCVDAARIIERNLTPVVEALWNSVIEECKKVVCDISEMYEKKKEGRVRIAESHEWSAFFICLALDELKGAPR